jgi:2-oxoglutarate ferredoxin oxidoreductase subunit beta
VQRCPHYLPHLFDPIVTDPAKSLILLHDDGLEISDELANVYKNHQDHDPSNLDRARELASMDDMVPVGVLYRNDNVAVYDELMKPKRVPNDETRREVLENEFDKFAVNIN